MCNQAPRVCESYFVTQLIYKVTSLVSHSFFTVIVNVMHAEAAVNIKGK